MRPDRELDKLTIPVTPVRSTAKKKVVGWGRNHVVDTLRGGTAVAHATVAKMRLTISGPASPETNGNEGGASRSKRVNTGQDIQMQCSMISGKVTGEYIYLGGHRW
jgi:hypothetical protein